MSEYNMKRKEQKQKFSKDDSVAALNAARQRVKEKKAAN
jgi:hypothetical protein